MIRARSMGIVDGMLALFALGLVGLALFSFVYGLDYYLLERANRDGHELHATFASGAGAGVAMGVLGTGLMLAMLSYTGRKMLARVQWLGPLDKWLKFHIICGVMGPVFILLHAGMQFPKGMIAVGFWCMVLVALSGTFGRYVYGFFPRLASGRSMALTEALVELTQLRAELVAATVSSRSHSIGQAVQLVQDLDYEADSIGDLFRLNAEVKRRRKQIRVLLGEAELPKQTYKLAKTALDDQLNLKWSLEASRVIFRLFRYWHLFHRPLATAMYVIVTLHVMMAVLFGGSVGVLMSFLGA